MDELVVALKLDPLELRLRCYSDRDQNTGEPYSSKNLRDCYRQGAEAFGWHSRNPEPRSMRDGKELVGWGMATGIWEALQMPIAVRIVLSANGHAEISCATSDMHDIKVIFVGEPDDIINPLGIKGVGEIGIVGVPAAIADAVYHATGKRVRDLPITFDKL
jgi:CO/xanthine dehydrogenase Mo-binding subunit